MLVSKLCPYNFANSNTLLTPCRSRSAGFRLAHSLFYWQRVIKNRIDNVINCIENLGSCQYKKKANIDFAL